MITGADPPLDKKADLLTFVCILDNDSSCYSTQRQMCFGKPCSTPHTRHPNPSIAMPWKTDEAVSECQRCIHLGQINRDYGGSGTNHINQLAQSAGGRQRLGAFAALSVLVRANDRR